MTTSTTTAPPLQLKLSLEHAVSLLNDELNTNRRSSSRNSNTAAVCTFLNSLLHAPCYGDGDGASASNHSNCNEDHTRKAVRALLANLRRTKGNRTYDAVEKIRYTRSNDDEEDVVAIVEDLDHDRSRAVPEGGTRPRNNRQLFIHEHMMDDDEDEEAYDGDRPQSHLQQQHVYPSMDDEDEDEEDDEAYRKGLPSVENALGPLASTQRTGVVIEGDADVNAGDDDDDGFFSNNILAQTFESVTNAVSELNIFASMTGNEISQEERMARFLCRNFAAAAKDGGEGGNNYDDDDDAYLEDVTAEHEGYDSILVSSSELDYANRFLCEGRNITKFNVSYESAGEKNFEDEVSRSSSSSYSSSSSSCSDDTSNHSANEDNDELEAGVVHPHSNAGNNPTTLNRFNLPILHLPDRTGFEESNELILVSGMIVADRYLVREELGSAAFSTAYRCMDMTSSSTEDEYVCLKVIRNKKDYFDQSLDEIRILQLLKDTNQCEEHNIYEMLDFFYYKEHLVIVTELLRQNLYEFGKFLIESQSTLQESEQIFFTLDRVAFVAKQVLEALNFIHSLGIIHTDVKPENILLNSYSRSTVKLIDFGSGCFVTDRPSSYIQSRSYRAPEVIVGTIYGTKIDMWSLGCVLAELYTGEVLFYNRSLPSMISKIEGLCGTFPIHMIRRGKYSKRYFTDAGLIFEEAERALHDASKEFEEEDEEEDHVYVLRAKVTTMAEKLGFTSVFRNENENLFIDFLTKVLVIDPENRLSAEEALQHPWIKQVTSLDSDKLRYP